MRGASHLPLSNLLAIDTQAVSGAGTTKVDSSGAASQKGAREGGESANWGQLMC